MATWCRLFERPTGSVRPRRQRQGQVPFLGSRTREEILCRRGGGTVSVLTPPPKA